MKQCNRNRLFGWLALVFISVVLLYFLPLLFFEARPETATFYVFAGGIFGVIVLRPDPLFAGALFSAVAGAALTLATFADPVLFGTLSMVILAVALFLVLKREMRVAYRSALPTIIAHTALVFSVTKYGHLPFT